MLVIGKRTEAFRTGLADAHHEHVVEGLALASAAEQGEVQEGKTRRIWDPSVESPFVWRLRRTMVKYRDDKGRLRRRVDVAKRAVKLSKAAESAARWHAGREAGQRARMATVGHCGDGEIRSTCTCCGSTAEAKVLCGVVRLCSRCSAKRSRKARARFAVAYGVVRERAERRGLLFRNRKGGAYSERHLVFTVPHVVVGDASESVVDDDNRQETAKRRIAIAFEAWKHFARALARFYRSCKRCGCQEKAKAHEEIEREDFHAWEPVARDAVTYRAFEWTPGADGMGHPHFHCWNFGPYLPERDFHRVESIAGGVRAPTTDCKGDDCDLCAAGVARSSGLRSWWARALGKAGVAIAPDLVIVAVRRVWARPIEFIREVRKPNGIVFRSKEVRVRLESQGEDLLRYLEGWCVATIDKDTRARAGDDVIAGVYVALEGKRLTQASSGFLGEADARMVSICDCDEIAPRAVAVTTWAMLVASAIAVGGGDAEATGSPAPTPRQRALNRRRALQAFESASKAARSEVQPHELQAECRRLEELCTWSRAIGAQYERDLAWKAREDHAEA